MEEENALLRKADGMNFLSKKSKNTILIKLFLELPPVTEHDYDEININDEGEQFDPNTVKVPVSRRRIRLANSCATVTLIRFCLIFIILGNRFRRIRRKSPEFRSE